MLMLDLKLSTTSVLFSIFPLLLLLFISCKSVFSGLFSSRNTSTTKHLPRSYLIIGSYPALFANRHRRIQWTSDVLTSSPSLTFVFHKLWGQRQVYTADPTNVHHILKSHFHAYEKGGLFKTALGDFLGDGIFNTDGENWKFQRQVSSHEFNTRSLRKFVETVVDTELSDRLVPILAAAAAQKRVLDFQDILQRFAFDNICRIAFGYDPGYLLPSLPEAKFAVAFEDAVRISSQRINSILPLIWKAKKFLNIGSEKQLRKAINEVREFAKEVIAEKKEEMDEKSSLESVDLLSRFLSSGHSEEEFVINIVISFILAGRDTTSAALTWFFWLLHNNPQVENEIMKEIGEKSEAPVYHEVKDMVYTHASLCESMRFYPPVPIDAKEAVQDDVLPDGIVVKKGMRVAYHPYAMGRLHKLWGPDWADFRPERWLEKDAADGKWSFVGKDAYTYPVFQAGPRICLGKEMAFLQMKRVVAGVLRRFKVVPVMKEGVEPVFISYLTAKMKGGFPVRIEERSQNF